MSEPANVTEFVSQYGNLANTVAGQTGLTQAEVLGQWGLETGWGSSMAGTNNLGNVMSNGVAVNYATPEAGAAAYVSALNYENVGDTATPSTFAAQLQAGGYAGNQTDYGSSVIGAVTAATNAGASTSTPNSFDNAMADAASSGSASTYTASAGNPDATATSNALTSSNPITNWISSKIGNYGLVFFGLVLGVGALLISNKGTVVNVTKALAE